MSSINGASTALARRQAIPTEGWGVISDPAWWQWPCEQAPCEGWDFGPWSWSLSMAWWADGSSTPHSAASTIGAMANMAMTSAKSAIIHRVFAMPDVILASYQISLSLTTAVRLGRPRAIRT
jgi:hypothetical protein